MAIPSGKKVPGIEIIDWNTQCNFPARANCQDILREVKRRFGKKPIGPEIAVRKSRKVLSRQRDSLIESVKRKTEAVLWLMKRFEWQFFLTGYFEGHRAGHNLWPIWEDFSSDPPDGAMLDVYRELDTQLGRLLAALNLSETALVVFSMHGMAPGFAQDHFLPVVMDRLNTLYARRTGKNGAAPAKASIARLMREYVPPSIQRQIRELFVGQAIQDWLIDRQFRGGKNWKLTPGFAMPGGGDVGFIRLNVVGRERTGCLPSSGSERVDYVNFLVQQLKALRVKETNEPLVHDVIMTSKEFPGPRSQFLPDILLTWQPKSPATEIWSQELGSVKAELKTGRGGNHTGESFALLAGAIDDADQLPPLQHITDYKNFTEALLGLS